MRLAFALNSAANWNFIYLFVLFGLLAYLIGRTLYCKFIFQRIFGNLLYTPFPNTNKLKPSHGLMLRTNEKSNWFDNYSFQSNQLWPISYQ